MKTRKKGITRKSKKTKKIENMILNAVIIILTIVAGAIFGLDLLVPEYQQEVSANVRVHFIDVGQADSILIQSNGEAMLIDAGDTGTRTKVVDYIKRQGIDTLKYVIGTHPHSDHIGGMAAVISDFNVENIMMPSVMHNSLTYEKLLDTIASKGLTITAPEVSDIFYVGGVKYTVLAPASETYSSLNDYSICLKMEYGATSFIFTGDAEKTSEREILGTGINISGDVLKVGHHGSSTSSHDAFLDAVLPEMAVISVGKGNSYGLPDETVIEALEDAGVVIYRTDEDGTIIMETDGNEITVKTYSAQ